MRAASYNFNFLLAIGVAAIIAVLFSVAIQRVDIDFNIVNSLPTEDPVISDAKYVIMNHPAQDQLVIDLSHQKNDPDILVQGGELVTLKLQKSGLFTSVGYGKTRDLFPELILFITKNLPVMFTESELKHEIQPLLKPDRVDTKLENSFAKLANIQGIGLEKLISSDPLELRNLVLKKLSQLVPSKKAQFYRGQLISSDGSHLLIITNPISAGTDTSFSRVATKLIDDISREINQQFSGQGYTFTLTPVGAYRAALDNELMARQDTKWAILFSTIGIALLLIFSFPRPLIGLLSLIPAIAGTILAFFFYSLLHKSVSILTLGFGGAIISITVDHGIAYFLLLDRPHQTSGKDAAREIRSIGLLAVLTTAGAFLTLTVSGFSILAQIGQFAAFGIVSSFLFTHIVFPVILPGLPPAQRKKKLAIQNLVNRLSDSGGKYKIYLIVALAVVMLFQARPGFNSNLKSINSISEETAAAEQLVRTVWGDLFSKVFLVLEGKSLQEIQEKADTLANMLEEDIRSGVLSSAFTSSMLFPGKSRADQNFTAWEKFWNPQRIEKLKNVMGKTAARLGFSAEAFQPFYHTISQKQPNHENIPENFLSLTGISKNSKANKWLQFSTLSTGNSYRAETFYSKYKSLTSVRIFDPAYFSKKFGEFLLETFLKMILIVSVSVIILLFIYFLDWKLTLVSILPVSFAMICTLGTLKIIGHPLGIPGLMLSIIIIGMGIDYSLFFVRAYQRYQDNSHPERGLIKLAVFLASGSSLIGFGVLIFADHALLKSAGLVSFLGIGYSLVGAFVILPPILNHIFTAKEQKK